MFHEAGFLGGSMIIHLLDEIKVQLFVKQCLISFNQGLR